MEMDERTMEAIAKGYENFPVALKAVSEQLEKMNSYLGKLTSKQEKEEEDEKNAAEQQKLIDKAVKELKKQGYDVRKADAGGGMPGEQRFGSAPSEAGKRALKPQYEGQEPIGPKPGEIPQGYAGLQAAEDEKEEYEEKKAEKEEYEEKKAEQENCEEPKEKKAKKSLKKQEDEEEEEEEKKGKKVSKQDDEEEEEEDEEEKSVKKQEKEEEEDEYPAPKQVQKAAQNAVEEYMKKLGWTKAGVQSGVVRPKSFGTSDAENISKGNKPLGRDEALDKLSKLSWRQLTEMEESVRNGAELPEIGD